jgi:hypothetical protein
VLTKPAGHEEVASAVLQVLEQVERGQVEGIPLPSVLQLLEAERRTCTLVVTSGRRRGRLHFESGRLINAFSEDFGAEGEAAAHDVLSWERTAIEFDRLPDGVRRLIHLPTQAFLVEVARRQDEAMNALAAHAPLAPRGAPHQAHPDAGATPSGTEEAAVPPANLAPDDPPMGEDATDPAATGEAATAEAATGASGHEPATTDPAASDAAASEPAAATGSDDPLFAEAPEAASAMTTPEAPAAASGGGPGPAPHDPTGSDAPGSSDAAATPAGTAAPPLEAPPAAPTDAPTHAPAAAPGGGASPTPEAPQSVQDLIAAIARLADRVQVADEALAAVASEVAAFHAAQQRYDAAVAQRDAQREARRRRTAAVRDDVAALAREILAKMDGLFDALTEDEPPDGPPGERSDAPPTGP